jgi:hypothetical protein
MGRAPILAGTHRRGRTVHWVATSLLAVLLVVGLLGAPGRVGAQESEGTAEETTLTWSVRPTPSESEPDRPNFSYDVSPGATITDSLRIRNFGTELLPLAVYASDALTTATGAIDLLPAGEQPVDVGAWTAMGASTVDVLPGEFVDVPFTVVVPADAEAGDHTGGIVTSYRAPGTDDEGRTVMVDRRLGSRMYVRVDGELRPELSVSDVDVSYDGTLNPLGTGTVDVAYTVTNTGNVRLGAGQTITVPGRLGMPGSEVVLEDMGELLPGSSLSFTTTVAHVWPTVRATAEVALVPIPTRAGDVFDAAPVASASASTWAIPWTGVAVVVVLLLVASWVWSRIRRRRRRAEAREDDATRTAVIVQEAVRAALATRDEAASGSGNGAASNGDAATVDVGGPASGAEEPPT